MIKILKSRRGGGALERLKNRDWSTPEERDRLLALVASDPDLTLPDVGWMVGAEEPALRSVGLRLVCRLNDPQTVEHFVKGWHLLTPLARQVAARSMGKMAPEGWERNLEALLQHRNPRYRSAAHEILKVSPLTRRLRRLLSRQIDSAEDDARKQALVRLLEDPDETDPEVLEAYLADPDEELRLRVVQALGSRRDPSHLELLASRLEAETHAVQEQLVRVLLDYTQAGHDVTSHVLPLLSGGDVALRQAAMRLLSQMPDRQRVVREFIAYSKTLSGWVRQRALETMAEFGEVLFEPALELLSDPDPAVRASAIFLAGSVREDAKLEAAILPLLQDADWWVRVTAAETLGDMRSQAAVPSLLKLLKDRDSRWSALEALARIRLPASLPEIVKLLREENHEVRVAAVKVLARFGVPETLGTLRRLCCDDPSAEVRHGALEAIKAVSCETGVHLDDEESLQLSADLGADRENAEVLPVVRLLLKARERGASDLHLTIGHPPMIRVRGELLELDNHPTLDAATARTLLRPLVTDDEATLARQGSLELCHAVPDRGRYRGSVFVDAKGLNAVFRVIPGKVPTLLDIGLPPHLAEMAAWHQGLVLVVGPAGSGKTTTLAALVNLVNETRAAHVITIEDPIEYVHHFKRSLINQRQLGRDTRNTQRALRAALREDPDVIVLGEMRDSETVRMALEAAETGHLVIATMNGTSALRAVDRIINSFSPEEQPQVRMMLSDTLKLAIGQSLVPRADGGGRVAAFEILMGLPTVAAVIRENKTFLLKSLVQTGRRLGMRSHDDSLMELVERGLVDPEMAYLRAHDKRAFEPLVSGDFLEGALV